MNTEVLSKYYFAYGSNMDMEQMAARCPGAEPIAEASLPGWKFRIYQRGYATITPQIGSTVWGGVWRVSEKHLSDLDRYEGVHRQMYQRKLVVVDRKGETLQAVTYVDRFEGSGIATPAYAETIRAGARGFTLPSRYLEEIEGELG